ncbi:hypothetical protein Vretimale_9618 [Volvox reticuliferus]|uniref:Uncharacterized protein n=1 Tax=Volvox reticuliferus TaxID=1737510 RepID=A0A8J4LP02_9CHLO|nr:hypothetical protein Vretimale_9618 [Volvox reticuliferus]
MVWPTITRPHSPTCIALAAETMRTLAAQRARATLARVDGSVAGSSAAVDTASSEDTEISLRGVKALRVTCSSGDPHGMARNGRNAQAGCRGQTTARWAIRVKCRGGTGGGS